MNALIKFEIEWRKYDLNVGSDVQGENYEKLIDYANKLCYEFSLVSKLLPEDMTKTMKDVLKELSPFLIEIIPGGDPSIEHLSWGGLPVLYYQFNKKTTKILKEYCNTLYSWLFPRLPEDLCFYKSGRIPWLINISHEQETCSYYITDEEIQELLKIEGLRVL